MQHGGTLEASSQGLGCGTTFTFTLPLYHVPDSKLPAALRDVGTVDEETSGIDREGRHVHKALRLLVVDDSMANRKLLARLLERRGHLCVLAQDGVQGTLLVEGALKSANPFDAILLDYEMPKAVSCWLESFEEVLILQSLIGPPFYAPLLHHNTGWTVSACSKCGGRKLVRKLTYCILSLTGRRRNESENWVVTRSSLESLETFSMKTLFTSKIVAPILCFPNPYIWGNWRGYGHNVGFLKQSNRALRSRAKSSHSFGDSQMLQKSRTTSTQSSQGIAEEFRCC